MDTEKLNDYSRTVYQLLVKDYPRWVRFMKNMPGHEESLVMRVRSAVSPKKYVIVSTHNREISVAFDYFHDHFGLGDMTPKGHYRAAKHLIDCIIADEILVATKFDAEGRWESSTTIHVDDFEEGDEICDEYDRIVGFNRVYKGQL
jgi:hypothetical protein